MQIKFGPAGNSESFYAQGYKESVQAPKWIHDMGLSAYEYSFGRGVRLREELAQQIGEQAKANDISMSVHCPYYVNLATMDPEKQEKNWQYVLQSVTMGEYMGAVRAVLHPGAASKTDRKAAFLQNLHAFADIKRRLKEQGRNSVLVCPETMGKINQLGDLEEVLTMCQVDEETVPCIDFGHLNARTHGGLKTQEDFAAVLDAIENRLGIERARVFHVHFSKIAYGNAGELKHLTFEDRQYGPEFEPLARELVARNWTPTIICESKGTMAEDALAMKKFYEKLKKE